VVPREEAEGIALGFAEPNGPVTEFPFKHPPLLSNMMRIDVNASGLCHFDFSNATLELGDWGHCFPLVPGHETIGVVTHKGDDVKGYDVGDRVGFGPFMWTCEECSACRAGKNNACEAGFKHSYNPEWGGWATSYQKPYDWFCHIPEEVPDEAAAPLM
jgi:uncharacterized zinc-type alcohol dehydrogenase-like protein